MSGGLDRGPWRPGVVVHVVYVDGRAGIGWLFMPEAPHVGDRVTVGGLSPVVVARTWVEGMVPDAAQSLRRTGIDTRFPRWHMVLSVAEVDAAP